MTAGFQPRTTFSRNKSGNLIEDKRQIKNGWIQYFEELLNSVKDALKTFRNTRTMGMDGMPIKLLKVMNIGMAIKFCELINTIQS